MNSIDRSRDCVELASRGRKAHKWLCHASSASHLDIVQLTQDRHRESTDEIVANPESLVLQETATTPRILLDIYLRRQHSNSCGTRSRWID